MRKSQKQMIMTIGVFGALAAFAVTLVYPQIAIAGDNAFRQSWSALAYETNELTREYQVHEGRWNSGAYTNEEMAEIVDSYKPRYQELIDRAESMETPEKFQKSRDLLISAIEAEMMSNDHFKNYLLSGDERELNRSQNLLSLSLKYSADADAAVRSAG